MSHLTCFPRAPAVTIAALQSFFRRCGEVADGLRSAIYASLQRSMLLLPEPGVCVRDNLRLEKLLFSFVLTL